jgi:hypothetical protein
MINAKDKKKETLAYRARAKAVDQMMQAGAGRSAPPDMSAPPATAPAPGMAPPAMKKGGAVKKKVAMKKGGKVPPKKPGLMIVIAMGKKKGR